MNRTLTGLLLVVLLASAALLQARQISRLGFDGENTPNECESLNGLYSVQIGRPLYHDASVPPHTLTAYPPLIYVIPGLVARAAGAGQLHSFIIGRMYLYLAWLAVALLILSLARRLGTGKVEATLGALLWLSGGLATEAAVSFRPDASAATATQLAAQRLQPDRATRAVGGFMLALPGGGQSRCTIRPSPATARRR